MKEKRNPLSCFDDDIGDDFLSAWQPSKINSIPNLDFDDAPETNFKLPANFDLDMDFGTGLNSKFSVFDIDLEFLESPKLGDLANENRREPQKTLSQASRDMLLEAKPDHDSSFHDSGQEREKVVSKSRNVEGTSVVKSQDQVTTSKVADSDEEFPWSQIEMIRTIEDSSEKEELPTPMQDVDLAVQRLIPTNSMKGRLLGINQEGTRPATQNHRPPPSLRKTNEGRISKPTTTGRSLRSNNVTSAIADYEHAEAKATGSK